MRTYHPKSWSQQAREMGDKMINSVNRGTRCIEQVELFFRNSYRHPRIVNRAAKRFGRAIRQNKVHEQISALEAWKIMKEGK